MKLFLLAHVQGQSRSCTTTSVRSYDQQSSDRPGSGAAQKSLRSGRFFACNVLSRQRQVFEPRGLQLKERTFDTTPKEPVNSACGPPSLFKRPGHDPLL
ncbi:hypothetical protein TNCV_3350531 [Trichonephila clavipes]|nr:hypothetical protein TNCV_3350531 [Trichonephila clavipes]